METKIAEKSDEPRPKLKLLHKTTWDKAAEENSPVKLLSNFNFVTTSTRSS
jgi:hypothetical protein